VPYRIATSVTGQVFLWTLLNWNWNACLYSGGGDKHHLWGFSAFYRTVKSYRRTRHVLMSWYFNTLMRWCVAVMYSVDQRNEMSWRRVIIVAYCATRPALQRHFHPLWSRATKPYRKRLTPHLLHTVITWHDDVFCLTIKLLYYSNCDVRIKIWLEGFLI